MFLNLILKTDFFFGIFTTIKKLHLFFTIVYILFNFPLTFFKLNFFFKIGGKILNKFLY